MSHYGSVNTNPHGSFVACALICALLAGCAKRPAPADPIVQTLAAGYDAYKADDPAALNSDIQRLAARLPGDETTGDFVSCTPRGYAMRRIERARRDLEYLDNLTVLSMGPEERYVYFQQLFDYPDVLLDAHGQMFSRVGALGDGVDGLAAQSDFECERAPGYRKSRIEDEQVDAAIQAAGSDRLRAWLIDLCTSLGPQFEPRMQNAALELYDNNLRPLAVDWRPPQPSPFDCDRDCVPPLARSDAQRWRPTLGW